MAARKVWLALLATLLVLGGCRDPNLEAGLFPGIDAGADVQGADADVQGADTDVAQPDSAADAGQDANDVGTGDIQVDIETIDVEKPDLQVDIETIDVAEPLGDVAQADLQVDGETIDVSEPLGDVDKSDLQVEIDTIQVDGADIQQDGETITDAQAAIDVAGDAAGDTATADAAPDVVNLCAGVTCLDSNPCTDDGCDPASGCTHGANAAPCDDGNACTAGDVCNASACLPGAATNCDDANSCTDDGCSPGSGCTHTANNAPCNDANACTNGDVCGSAMCLPGAPTTCEDGNVCTDDGCNYLSGCTHNVNSAPCTDGNACTSSEQCGGGACVGGSAVICGIPNACIVNSCDPLSGCQSSPVPDGSPCSDGNACTTIDGCKDGACLGSSPVACPKPSLCHLQGTCNPSNGICGNPIVFDGTECWDGDVCHTKGNCSGGVCNGETVVDCDDKNACTTDSCGTGGCTHDGLPDGASCGPNRTCQAKQCVCPPGAVAVDIDDGSSVQTVCAFDYPVWGQRSLLPDAYLTATPDGSVLDSQTGLEWQQTADQDYDWASAQGHCDSLSLAGHKDWRLPTVAELMTIVDFAHEIPLPGAAFPNDKMGNYWALQGMANSASAAWRVDYAVGEASPSKVSQLLIVRCVRSDTLWSAPTPRFVATASNSFVHDGATGLVWMAEPATKACGGNGLCTAAQASAWCVSHPLGDGSPLHLPGLHELDSLLDHSQVSPATIAPMPFSTAMWTSTPVAAVPGSHWLVDFGGGGTQPMDSAQAHVFACVTSCDDGNACTADSFSVAKEACVHTDVADGTVCSEGNACTVAATCTAGVCGGSGPKFFDNTYGGSADTDGFAGVAQRSDGGLWLAGATQTKSAGDNDLWLVRTDATGSVQVDTRYGGVGSDVGHGVVALADGGAFAVGDATSPGAAVSDGWALRVDAAGSHAWDSAFGGISIDSLQAIAQTSATTFVFAGYTGSSGAGGFDGWLLLHDVNTGKSQELTFGGKGTDAFYAVVALPTGGLALAGVTDTKGAGDKDFWLVRTDAAGVQVGEATFGSSGTESLKGLTLMPDGGFALIGSAPGFATTNLWLVRTDAAGQKLWSRTFGGSVDQAGYGAIALADGSLRLWGTISLPLPYMQDALLIATDPWGNQTWSQSYGGLGADLAQAIISTGDGGLAMVGQTAGTADGWLLRADNWGETSCKGLNSCAGIGTCDDGNPCTADICTAMGTCGHTTLDEWSPCGDAKICVGKGFCQDVKTAKGMAFVPAGTFWMGCNAAKDNQCQSDESPQHKVTLSGYYVDLTETTVAQYKACVDQSKCTAPGTGADATWPTSTSKPVNYVTWDQAETYCEWMGGRLPTEAQWEMAARGRCEENGSSAADATCAVAMRSYPWGDQYVSCYYAVFYGLGGPGCGATTVPEYPMLKGNGTSPFGAYDMLGNVSEWTRDWYAATQYSSSQAFDPEGTAVSSDRVLRGGNFNTQGTTGMRAGERGSWGPSGKSSEVGFRCARAYP